MVMNQYPSGISITYLGLISRVNTINYTNALLNFLELCDIQVQLFDYFYSANFVFLVVLVDLPSTLVVVLAS